MSSCTPHQCRFIICRSFPVILILHRYISQLQHVIVAINIKPRTNTGLTVQYMNHLPFGLCHIARLWLCSTIVHSESLYHFTKSGVCYWYIQRQSDVYKLVNPDLCLVARVEQNNWTAAWSSPRSSARLGKSLFWLSTHSLNVPRRLTTEFPEFVWDEPQWRRERGVFIMFWECTFVYLKERN